nr:MAG TPA: hypothetical protein [Caudoviricetes sp.]
MLVHRTSYYIHICIAIYAYTRRSHGEGARPEVGGNNHRTLYEKHNVLRNSFHTWWVSYRISTTPHSG